MDRLGAKRSVITNTSNQPPSLASLLNLVQCEYYANLLLRGEKRIWRLGGLIRVVCVFPVITGTVLFQEKVRHLSNVKNILKTQGILNIPPFPLLSVQDIKYRNRDGFGLNSTGRGIRTFKYSTNHQNPRASLTRKT